LDAKSALEVAGTGSDSGSPTFDPQLETMPPASGDAARRIADQIPLAKPIEDGKEARPQVVRGVELERFSAGLVSQPPEKPSRRRVAKGETVRYHISPPGCVDNLIRGQPARRVAAVAEDDEKVAPWVPLSSIMAAYVAS
jgi:hypothetical protein